MVKLAAITTAALAALAGTATAQLSCNVNQIYCGYNLTSTDQRWQAEITNALEDAGQPIRPDGDNIYHSLFRCNGSTVTNERLEWRAYCAGPLNVRCHPNERDACRRQHPFNHCCDAN